MTSVSIERRDVSICSSHLATPSAADDTNTLSRLHLERDVLKDLRTGLGVARRKLFDLETATSWPICRGYALRLGRRFVLDDEILLDTFQTIACETDVLEYAAGISRQHVPEISNWLKTRTNCRMVPLKAAAQHDYQHRQHSA